MRIVTKHFGFAIERPWYDYRRRWRNWSIKIGFAATGRGPYAPRYRLWGQADLQLWPNFIWWQQDLGAPQAHGIRYHARLAGVHSWPLLRFYGGKA